ncbi:MAG: LysR family transcriptional regulator [Trueperella sp.]|nr:LysR family transcriptional regulator [Trueperella sp.]
MKLPKFALMIVAKIQARSPKFFASIMHLLTSKSGKKRREPTAGELAAIAAAKAEKAERAKRPLTRTDGVLAANRAAGIPGA